MSSIATTLPNAQELNKKVYINETHSKGLVRGFASEEMIKLLLCRQIT